MASIGSFFASVSAEVGFGLTVALDIEFETHTRDAVPEVETS